MKTNVIRMLSLFLCVACASVTAWAQAPAELVGTWRSAGETPLVLKLNADQTGSLGESPFNYAVLGDKLLVKEGESISTYTFAFKNGRLTLFMEDGRGLQFERVGGGSDATATTGRAQQAKTPDNPLLGHWVASGITAEVRDDGTIILNGQTIRYKVEGNILRLTSDEGTMSYPFRLSGDTLTVETDEGEIVYRRPTGGRSGDMTTARGANPRELLGKWCYMSNVNSYSGGRMSNRCFTLNADGTYEFYSETSSSGPVASSASQEYDTGTWTATANTITANSRTRGTTTTYPLEKRNHPKTGDPMLVLDGDAYVTFNQRQPWP